VAPEFRRAGVGSALVRAALSRHIGEVFLEVRESNIAAQNFYQKLGFRHHDTRPGYYEDPREAAIVMRFQAC
jgi:ribosomal-protein-alanine N-acetyltransferase